MITDRHIMNNNKLALAREYRPHTFEGVVGQEITLRALSNALDNQRLHHAYLFTGTRGVGKTTIARILAKCLNCERGISSTPCGQCGTCIEIDKGCFPDLIEVDAASRTKVEDTRELLDNVQYLPTRGRFKIYLIDEVHMLSGHSFNALLKTLEEPPSHVKFLLATTDPQKLPATVLSRCLKFHLWRLPIPKIVRHLAFVLEREGVSAENDALVELAHAADGSLRDALSLLDQAISYSHTGITASTVRTMLGLSEKEQLLALLNTIAHGDSQEVLKKIEQLAENAPDFSGLLTELLTMIHQVAIAQCSKEALDEDLQKSEKLIQLAGLCSREEIQLYYQIGIAGQRDLAYAPSPKMGFEMILLRMVAFQPVRIGNFVAKDNSENVPVATQTNFIPKSAISQSLPAAQSSAVPQSSEPLKMAATITIPPEVAIEDLTADLRRTEMMDPPNWRTVVQQLNLSGLVKVLAENSIVAEWSADFIHLVVDSAQKTLLNKRYEDRLRDVLSQHLGKEIRLKMTEGKITENTPALQNQRHLQETTDAAHQMIEVDTKIQRLIQAFDAKIDNVLLKDKK